MNNKPEVTIFTDGSCDKNPGPGGWAAILRWVDKEDVLTGHSTETTNNRMEITAAINALGALKVPTRVTLYTDSEYLKRGVEEWMENWRARGWKRKKGKLANVDLWKALDKAMALHDIDWRWVKAHAGNSLNNRVDRLARAAMMRNK